MRSFLGSLFPARRPLRKTQRRKPACRVELLEARTMMTADALPVLMVIADGQDFYYQEYGDTRDSIEAQGLSVEVAATTTNPSTPHPNTGQGDGDGVAVPDLALADVDPDNYSAIVFVGGWGASMYQYAFPGDYQNDNYDGDLATKTVVNDLINEFLDSDKLVAAICHGTTVLDWARRGGVSPVAGKQVSVPYIGSPAVFYDGEWYGNYALGQYEQAVANGAVANTASGQYGDPTTVADDVVFDGGIMTAENYDAAAYFGTRIAEVVLAAADPLPPANQAPIATDSAWELDENSALGTVAGLLSATDPDAGQTLSYAIIGGNDGNAFAIDAATGAITVSNASALDFESAPIFHLLVEVTDDGETPLSDVAQVTVQLRDLNEGPPASASVFGNDLIVQGTSGDDTIYIWSSAADEQVFVWANGEMLASHVMTGGGRVIVRGGDGNDQIYATDARYGVEIYGQGGHDLITGGSANDLIAGGGGVDRITANGGDDLVFGGAGDDYLFDGEGNDILVGGDGNDYVHGSSGRNILIGGLGADTLRGGADEDLLIGGATDHDHDAAALVDLLSRWAGPGSIAERSRLLTATSATLHIRPDFDLDTLCGSGAADLYFAGLADIFEIKVDDLVSFI